jgi:2-iminobutanoate/2-iminopropanoate deaminase
VTNIQIAIILQNPIKSSFIFALVNFVLQFAFCFNLLILYEKTGEKNMKKCIQTEKAPKAIGPYSQAVQFGSFLFISGQIPIDPFTGLYNPSSIEEETEIVMKNMGAILESAGLAYDDVVKTTIYIVNMNDFASINEVYGKYFSNQPPARACIEVKRLPKNCKVEIDAIAAFPYCK